MKCPTVKWSGIQNGLEEAESDVLLLLDCCHAGITSTDEGQGVTELISACPYNSTTNGVGYYSFTHALVLELRALALRPSFSIGDLYSRIYCRTQIRMPDDEMGTERHPAPVHLVLTCDRHFPRGIQLAPRKRLKKKEGSPTRIQESPSPANAHWSSDGNSHKDEDVPRLALAIRLQNLSLSELSTELFTEWLRSMPMVAEQVKVEAGFDSFSTLLIVSIPMSLSVYLQWNPAVMSLGPVTSSLRLIMPTWSQAPPEHAPDRDFLSLVSQSRLARLGESGPLSDSAESGYHSSSETSRTREKLVDLSSKSRHVGSSTSMAAGKAPLAKRSLPPIAHSSSKRAETRLTSRRNQDTQEALEYTSSTLEEKADDVRNLPKSRPTTSLATRTETNLYVVPENSRVSTTTGVPIATTDRPSTSFLFIVNELPTNDDPDVMGSIPPRMLDGRYHPPTVAHGFFPQVPGYVFRWKDGVVSLASGYAWSTQQIGNPPYAQGTIFANSTTGIILPEYYRASTVFYCNHFAKFFATRGDASTRDIGDTAVPEDSWQPLSFIHNNNISYVQHSGDQEFLAVRHASWIEQLLSNTYRRHSRHGPAEGGLSGLLPIVIALMAFSCTNCDELYRVLIDGRAWRGHRWVPHLRENGRIERRGLVVTVYLDPENPQGSTYETISALEMGPTPILR